MEESSDTGDGSLRSHFEGSSVIAGVGGTNITGFGELFLVDFTIGGFSTVFMPSSAGAEIT